MNKKLRKVIDIIGLGWLAIVSTTFCFAIFGYVFNIKTEGMDSPVLLIIVLILTLWGFYSLKQLPKYIKINYNNNGK